MVVGHFHVLTALPWRTLYLYPLDRRLSGPKSDLGLVVTGKISASVKNQTLAVQPIAGQYNDWRRLQFLTFVFTSATFIEYTIDKLACQIFQFGSYHKCAVLPVHVPVQLLMLLPYIQEVAGSNIFRDFPRPIWGNTVISQNRPMTAYTHIPSDSPFMIILLLNSIQPLRLTKYN
jgi:hypothetical protein